MKVEDFVDKLKMTAGLQTTYLSGGFGCRLGKDWYNKDYSWNKQHASEIEAKYNTTPITFGFDCVCYLKACLFWDYEGNPLKENGGSKYSKDTDLTTQAMIDSCADLTDKNWDTIEAGEFVWMKGHIGVYVGDGLVLEATPSWESGVQYSALGNVGKVNGYPTRTWTKHGHSSFVDFTNAKYSALQAQIRRVESERDIIKAECETLRNEVVALNNTVSEWQKKYSDLQSDYSKAQERIFSLRQDLEKSATKYLTELTLKKQAIKEKEELQKELDKLKNGSIFERIKIAISAKEK